MNVFDMHADLKSQSKADKRLKYDGHNRRSMLFSRKRLARRRSRRRGRQFIRTGLCGGWNTRAADSSS